MIENRQFRFKEPQVAVPDGIPEAIERAAFGRALRWYVGEVGAGEVVVEATVDSQEVGNFGAGVGSLFFPGKAVAVSIIPTGIGCSIGGYAGDAAPVSRLLASTVDYLVTNPNAVNASDFIQLTDNTLYTEGSCIDLFCRGLVNLHVANANRVGVVVEQARDADLDQVWNVINAMRAVHGVDVAHCVLTDRPIGSRCRRNPSGGYVGTVENPEVLIDACAQLLAHGADAIAVTTNVQDLPAEEYALHFAGRAPNPVGGVEAIISHLVVDRFRVPAAHAPMINSCHLPLSDRVVDARGAGEMASASGLACVLVGLARAPQIAPRPGRLVRDVVNVNNLMAVVAPASSLGGIPTLFADRAGVPTIAVRDNHTILDVTAERLGLRHVVEVGGYLEAAGALVALRQGINPKALRRPLATLRHETSRHQAAALRTAGAAR
ncbi:MAG TPA: DUF3326 domain-containing protein [Thermoanaerobaculia bacterium]|nr:DUF3326 domain-containing protein [Thermoanaerobaculia bacterium]